MMKISYWVRGEGDIGVGVGESTTSKRLMQKLQLDIGELKINSTNYYNEKYVCISY